MYVRHKIYDIEQKSPFLFLFVPLKKVVDRVTIVVEVWTTLAPEHCIFTGHNERG